jgi:16S rRNA (uracil1498-N3)-methyltransferase
MSLPPRIFVTDELKINQKISLDVASSKHVLGALRLKLHDHLRVFNNSGKEFKGSVVSINKNLATVILEELVPNQTESPLSIHLGQGISRGEKMDFTIQKAVELGINTITPLFTTYCNVKLDDERLSKRCAHWQKIAISAAEQSGRAYIPKIMPGQNLKAWLPNVADGLCLVLDPNAQNKISNFPFKNKPERITILVGPEGGLSEDEILKANSLEFLPVSLGPRILRTETAALVAISILQARWGDL